ncbi:hypothetical protein BGX27_005757 [Mortierella sp. AM989]|nr:hypothetical protein BGX27_005757 [Mortierella sp. AM989]
MRQDFDSWAAGINFRFRHMLGKEQLPGPDHGEPDLYYDYDSFLFDLGAWSAGGFGIGELWTTERFIAYMSELLWDLAKARIMRREHYKNTGEGFSDLRLVWTGQIPWPDTRTDAPDMRTNPRLRYWETLTNEEIRKINEYYKDEGGIFEHLNHFNKVMPYRHLSPDTSHHTDKRPVDAVLQALIHKYNLCNV